MGPLDEPPCRPAVHDEVTVESGDGPREPEVALLKIREHLRGPGGRVVVVHRLQNHLRGAPGVALTAWLRPGVRSSETERSQHVLRRAAGSHAKRLPSTIPSPTRNRRRHRRHGIQDAVASAPRQKRTFAETGNDRLSLSERPGSVIRSRAFFALRRAGLFAQAGHRRGLTGGGRGHKASLMITSAPYRECSVPSSKTCLSFWKPPALPQRSRRLEGMHCFSRVVRSFLRSWRA